jgi:hypothetical protein
MLLRLAARDTFRSPAEKHELLFPNGTALNAKRDLHRTLRPFAGRKSQREHPEDSGSTLLLTAFSRKFMWYCHGAEIQRSPHPMDHRVKREGL